MANKKNSDSSIAKPIDSDADKLRRNFARYLVKDYLESPVKIAELCDTELDRSGVLLGYVREEAYKFKKETEE